MDRSKAWSSVPRLSTRAAARRYVLGIVLLALPRMSLAQAPCPGDCDRGGVVRLDEVILCVHISLGGIGLEDCPDADAHGDGRVGIDDLVSAVRSSVQSCPAVEFTPTASPTASPSPSPTATATQSADVPTERAALETWLQAGSYLDWAAEGEIHPPDSPHPSLVRVFINDLLFRSLEEGRVEHPAGAAAVKEIYSANEELRGWAVTVKLQEEGDGGRGWYWYERVGSSLFANGPGAAGCTGCHSEGTDFFRTPFPLRP